MNVQLVNSLFGGGGRVVGDVIQFVAKDVALDPQVGFVGFADQEGQRYFWMQPGEMTTAKNEIWLERDDQAWGGCGGAWNLFLTRNKFIATHGISLGWRVIRLRSSFPWTMRHIHGSRGCSNR